MKLSKIIKLSKMIKMIKFDTQRKSSAYHIYFHLTNFRGTIQSYDNCTLVCYILTMIIPLIVYNFFNSYDITNNTAIISAILSKISQYFSHKKNQISPLDNRLLITSLVLRKSSASLSLLKTQIYTYLSLSIPA